MTPTPVQISALEQAARDAASRSYSPYSNFRVGAAILTASGRVFSGTNVENASYGLCNCAERTAVFSAVAAGERVVTACVVYTPTPKATAPCGACRQVLREFGPKAWLKSVCDSADSFEATVETLLPRSFGPEDLGK